MNWKLWLEGLGTAVLGGAVTGVTQLASGSGQLTKGTGFAAALGAIFGAAAYLKQPANQVQVQFKPAQAPTEVAPPK